jgi:hypothetical protein
MVGHILVGCVLTDLRSRPIDHEIDQGILGQMVERVTQTLARHHTSLACHGFAPLRDRTVESR